MTYFRLNSQNITEHSRARATAPHHPHKALAPPPRRAIPAFPPHKDPPKATGDPCQIRHSGPDFAARPRRQRISLPWKESLISARAGTMEPWVAVCLREPRLRSPGPRVEASDLPQENNITPSSCLSIWGAKRIRNHGRAWCCVCPGELRRGPSSPLRSIVLSSSRVDGSVIRVIPMSRTGPGDAVLSFRLNSVLIPPHPRKRVSQSLHIVCFVLGLVTQSPHCRLILITPLIL